MLQIIFLDPGRVPLSFEISSIPEYDKEHYTEEILPKYYLLGRVGFCVKCKRDRPHRSHHCKICRTCIMRYDHHCVFLGSCIGLKNTKLFILYLLYSFLSCLLVFSDCSIFLFTEDFETNVLVMALLSGSIGLVLLSIMTIHFSSICINVTGVEFKWRAQDMFDWGVINNIKQVFGDTFVLWLVPVYSSECDGIKYPMRIRKKNNSEIEEVRKFLI